MNILSWVPKIVRSHRQPETEISRLSPRAVKGTKTDGVGVFKIKLKESAYSNHKSFKVLYLYFQNNSDSNHSIHGIELIMQMTRVNKRLSPTVLYCQQRLSILVSHI
jgi:hypothetical protein